MKQTIVVFSFKTLWSRMLAYIMFVTIQVGVSSNSINDKPRLYLQFFITIVEIFILCFYHDYTDKKDFGVIYQSREKLRKFQDLLSNDLPSSVIIMASDRSSVLYSNKFFQEKFTIHQNKNNIPVKVDELFGKLIIQENNSKILDKKQQNHSFKAHLRELDTPNIHIQDTEVDTLHAFCEGEDGDGELYYEIKLRKIIWDGRSSYAIVMNDISDKQMVAALKIADEHKDRIIATVSHELRTPINGILGLLEMASEKTVDYAQLEFLNYCKSCSKLLLYLVNAILDLSQLRQNTLKIVRNTFNITELLEEVRSLYIFQSHQKGVEFIIDKDSTVPEQV